MNDLRIIDNIEKLEKKCFLRLPAEIKKFGGIYELIFNQNKWRYKSFKWYLLWRNKKQK